MVAPKPLAKKKGQKLPSEAELIAALKSADDWDRVAKTDVEMAESGQRIRARALAAEQLLAIKASSKEALAALEERARKRSLHKDWMFHGFDGAIDCGRDSTICVAAIRCSTNSSPPKTGWSPNDCLRRRREESDTDRHAARRGHAAGNRTAFLG